MSDLSLFRWLLLPSDVNFCTRLPWCSLAGVDVALRIGRDRCHRQELTRVSAAAAERADLGERVAIHDADLLVLPVGDEDEALLRIAREARCPTPSRRRSAARRSCRSTIAAHGGLGDDAFLDELAGLVEHLDAVAALVADVDHAVSRDLDAASRRGTTSAAGAFGS